MLSEVFASAIEFKRQNSAYENISFILDAFRINWKSTKLVPVMFFRAAGAWIGVLGRRSLDTFVPDVMAISPVTDDYKIQRIVSQAAEHLASLGLKLPVPALVSRGSPRGDAGIMEMVIKDDFSAIEYLQGNSGFHEPHLAEILAVMPAYPVPFYHEYMGAYLKSLLITRNLSLRPPVSEEDLLISGTEFGYARSIQRSRDFIRRDLSDVLSDLIRSGTFLRRGSYLYYPYTEGEYRRRFLKRFVRYKELQSKRTIFDFS